MKRFIILFASIFATRAWATDLCRPGDVYKTGTNAVFECVVLPTLAAGWQDPSGKVWSSNQGLYGNSGPSNNRQILESESTRVCESMGMRLPSETDYVSFRKYFEISIEKGVTCEWFSAQGMIDLLTLFPDAWSFAFWSSTTPLFAPSHAVVFDGNDGSLITAPRRGTRASVRCIKP